MYGPTQMLPTPDNSGHIYGTDATNKPGSIKFVKRGKGYHVGDKMTLICNGYTGTSSPADAVVEVVSVNPDGGILDFTITDGTESYTKGFATAGVRTEGPIGTVSVGAGGTSYSVGDLLTITQTGAANGVYSVASLSGSAVATVTLVSRGTGYSVAAGLATTTNGGGSGCTLDVDTVLDVDAAGKNYNKAVWEISNVGLPAAATVTGIDVHLDDIDSWETYQVRVHEAGEGNRTQPASTSPGWTDYHPKDKYGKLTSLALVAGGTGYTVGDVLTLAGGTGGTVTVTSVSGGVVDGFSKTTRGTGYTVTTPVAVTGGTGNDDATFNVTAVDDFTVSTGTITFTDSSGFNDGIPLPSQGDWLWNEAADTGDNVYTMTATEVGATPTVDPRSTSTGAKIVQVAKVGAGAIIPANIDVNDGGSGYEVNDIITLVQAGGSGCKIKVLSVTGGAIDGTEGTGFAVIQTGTGYSVGAATSTGHTGDATFTISTAVGTAGQFITVPVTNAYALSGGSNLIITFVDDAIPEATAQVRMCHTFALGNKITPAHVLDTGEIYRVTVDGTIKVLTTDYTVEAGPFIKFAAGKSPAAAEAVVVWAQTPDVVVPAADILGFALGAGGWNYEFLVPTATTVLAVSYV
jgi:hypothetical protein